MKLLGIDYGTKRIGIAVSDDTGTLAFPHSTIQASSEALQTITKLALELGVEKIIVGESRNLENKPNKVMEDIDLFKTDLAELTNLPVLYELEFFSSVAAARQFAPDGSRKKNPSHDKLDASAAAIILQSYIDHNPRVQ